jgi:hypothetical protein
MSGAGHSSIVAERSAASPLHDWRTPMKSLCSAKLRLVAVTAILTLAAPPPAKADVVFNGDVAIVPSIVNPCNGEIVVLTGTAHVVAEETFTPSGNIHVSTHINAVGVSGVGMTTGAKYSISNSLTEELTFAGATEETVNDTFRIIGQGQVPNFNLHELIHVTINANGTVTVAFETFNETCD